jgi:hypothetical protein
MKKQTDKNVGISCSGFIALQNGELIASAKTFDKLTDKESVKDLLGNRSLLIKHVAPKETVRIY